jgi:hypothetical protein
MNTFFECLQEYNSFLEKTSYTVINNKDMDLVKEEFKQINESLSQLKKNNVELSNSKLNMIRANAGIKLFDINKRDYTKFEKIALVHFFVEILLNKHISLNKIFKNGKQKIWIQISDFLDYLLFLFSEAFISNLKPIVHLEIL